MGRKTFHDLQLYEITQDGPELLVDNKDIHQVKKLTWNYMALVTPVYLKPSERKKYVVLFKPKNTFYIPISIDDPTSFRHKRRIKDAITFGSIVDILVLAIVNTSFFFFTSRKEFVWLALAEAFYTLQILSSAGYTSYFSGFSDPAYGNYFSIVAKSFFCIFMAKFAQLFLKTRKNYPRTHLILSIFITVALLNFIFASFYHTFFGSLNMIALTASWFITLGVSIILPIIAIRATLKLNKNYWPLVVAWTIFSLFILYGLLHTLDIIQVFPLMHAIRFWHKDTTGFVTYLSNGKIATP